MQARPGLQSLYEAQESYSFFVPALSQSLALRLVSQMQVFDPHWVLGLVRLHGIVQTFEFGTAVPGGS